MQRIGRIDIECDDLDALRAHLSNGTSIYELVPALFRWNTHSEFVSSRIERLSARPSRSVSDRIRDDLAGAGEWIDQAAQGHARRRVFSNMLFHLYDDDQCYFNVKMCEARLRQGTPVLFVPPSDHYRTRFERLHLCGSVDRGAEIPLNERLAAMPMSVLRALAGPRDIKGRTKGAIAERLETDEVLRRVIDQNSRNFFRVHPLGFDFADFAAEFAIWAVLASVLVRAAELVD
ncbi:hypothetical protein [Dokdonella immobilis]|uniref:Uncharacterized protein n=1 Tax=Dokdonella immobilis TaxID=578942 RepID=A0A1I4VVQ3_9GAMM|nr:hypothetical protein [Dokdonella immobilis]SFN05097.1 hypothetical protein SAMN05216289_10382 [Dokdonella immobilis]